MKNTQSHLLPLSELFVRSSWRPSETRLHQAIQWRSHQERERLCHPREAWGASLHAVSTFFSLTVMPSPPSPSPLASYLSHSVGYVSPGNRWTLSTRDRFGFLASVQFEFAVTSSIQDKQIFLCARKRRQHVEHVTIDNLLALFTWTLTTRTRRHFNHGDDANKLLWWKLGARTPSKTAIMMARTIAATGNARGQLLHMCVRACLLAEFVNIWLYILLCLSQTHYSYLGPF